MGVGCLYPASRTAVSASFERPSSSKLVVSCSAAASTAACVSGETAEIVASLFDIVPEAAHRGRAPGTFPGPMTHKVAGERRARLAIIAEPSSPDSARGAL